MSHYSCKHFNKTLSDLITPIIKRRGLTQASIILDWDKIIPNLANYCLPIKLKFPYQQRTDGTLYLWVDSGSALQLEYSKDIIIANINTYFGYNAVSSLRFQQTTLQTVRPSRHKPIMSLKKSARIPDTVSSFKNTFDDIPCPKLRDTLIDFGQSMGCLQ